eukprot:365693-Chlamydomonas_euryale.AAC.7
MSAAADSERNQGRVCPARRTLLPARVANINHEVLMTVSVPIWFCISSLSCGPPALLTTSLPAPEQQRCIVAQCNRDRVHVLRGRGPLWLAEICGGNAGAPGPCSHRVGGGRRAARAAAGAVCKQCGARVCGEAGTSMGLSVRRKQTRKPACTL